MNTRPFDWRDLPILSRYRSEGVFLDQTLLLRRGPILVPAGAFLSYLALATGVFTYLEADPPADSLPLMAQLFHPSGQPAARLTYLGPKNRFHLKGIAALLERLAVLVGERGALRILAEVDEQTQVFDLLRELGFGIYAWQRIWRLYEPAEDQTFPGLWRAISQKDEAAMYFLYSSLVPGLAQQMDLPPSGRVRGLVYYQGNELQSYVDIKYGSSGIWAQPFIHPDAEQAASKLIAALQSLPYRRGRPVYVCVRSYQSWLEPVMDGLGAQASARQAVMVNHLALTKRVPQTHPISAMNTKTPEPTVPVAQVETMDKV